MANKKEKKEHIFDQTKLIQYSLKEIVDRKFSFTAPTKAPALSDEPIELTIKHTITPEIKYKIDASDILVVMHVRAFIHETDETVMEAENAFIYHAVDLKTFLEYEEDKKSWKFLDVKNEALITTLIGLSLSTMRGILYEKSKGTVLETTPIPVMNPAVFVKSQDSTN